MQCLLVNPCLLHCWPAAAGPLELTDWAVSTATLDHVFSAILAAANNTNAEPDGVDQVCFDPQMF
jgi:hypothetical protein